MPHLPLDRILRGDALKVLQRLPSESIDCVVTSPPYWALRDYGVKGQLGLESTFHEYMDKLCAVFDEVRRVLKPAGTCWVNMGDTYSSSMKGGGSLNVRGDGLYDRLRQRAGFDPVKLKTGLPPKTLCQIPSRFAIAMTDRGWILRNEIIWWKPNCMPQSARDRFTVDFEKVFFFVKSRRYYFKQQYEEVKDKARLERRLFDPKAKRKRVYGDLRIAAINPKTVEASRQRMLKFGRRKRSVWRIAVRPYPEAHFAVYPPELAETPIKAGCPEGGIVLDPFMGSGTTSLVAQRLGRHFVGIELNPEYVRLARQRLRCMSRTLD
jgi:DNA modification methylase